MDVIRVSLKYGFCKNTWIKKIIPSDPKQLIFFHLSQILFIFKICQTVSYRLKLWMEMGARIIKYLFWLCPKNTYENLRTVRESRFSRIIKLTGEIVILPRIELRDCSLFTSSCAWYMLDSLFASLGIETATNTMSRQEVRYSSSVSPWIVSNQIIRIRKITF